VKVQDDQGGSFPGLGLKYGAVVTVAGIDEKSQSGPDPEIGNEAPLMVSVDELSL